MLQIKHITIHHKKDYRILLEDFNLCINPGDKCALIGEEGNGKSTLLKLIYSPELAEEYVEYEGEILRTGECFAYLPQELPEQQRENTIYGFLTAADNFYDKSPKELALLCAKISFPVERLYSEEPLTSFPGAKKSKYSSYACSSKIRQCFFSMSHPMT